MPRDKNKSNRDTSKVNKEISRYSLTIASQLLVEDDPVSAVKISSSLNLLSIAANMASAGDEKESRRLLATAKKLYKSEGK